jgi:hypothetical protein
MASLGESFKTSEMDQPSNSFEPLPNGWYDATITGAEVKDTKSGTGQYIAVRFDITGPTHQGRVVFTNVNIRNSSVKAEKFGREQFAAILLAGGIASATDSDQLIGASMKIELGLEHSEEYGDKNKIKSYKALGGAMPSALKTSAPKSANGPSWASK